eukprot:1013964-Amphidinium_carterae.1
MFRGGVWGIFTCYCSYKFAHRALVAGSGRRSPWGCQNELLGEQCNALGERRATESRGLSHRHEKGKTY